MARPKLNRGDFVQIVGGDYTLKGRITSVYAKYSHDLSEVTDLVRYDVQVQDTGLLLIQNRDRLRKLDASGAVILEPGDKGYRPPEITNPDVLISRLYAGARIVFSRDGEDAWLTDGDKERVGYDVLLSLRKDGTIERKRRIDDESISEWDELSAMGRNYAEVTLKCKPRDGW